jgi:hypothetical protein
MIIDRFVRFFLPRQDLFFTLLEDIAGKMTAAATIFGELMTATTLMARGYREFSFSRSGTQAAVEMRPK